MSHRGGPASYSWRALENSVRIRGIMEQRLPQWRTGPRDFQVEIWAHILDKISVLLIAHTGGGKTAAFWGPVLIIQDLLQHPVPGMPKLPSKPVVIIITPLVELGNNHAREINELGLKAVAINSETVCTASAEGRNLYTEVRSCLWSVVLLSPERLSLPDVDRILRDDSFRENLVLLGIDEAHVLVPWGNDFRSAYRQVGPLIKRLPPHCVTVAVTATLSPGRDYDALCSALDFKPARFHCMRQASERPNVRAVITELRHGLTGWTFPDIRWVFTTPGVKAVVYCASLDLQLRVALFGWNQQDTGPKRLENVRVWSSITSQAYNLRTLELFENNPDTCVIVASIAFGLGMNVRSITDSINLGIPDTVEALVQQNGRAGRDLQMEARGWTYLEPAVVASVQEEIEAGLFVDAGCQEVGPTKKKGKNAKDDKSKNGRSRRVVEEKLKDVVAAHLQGRCINVQLNMLLGNPDDDACQPCEAAARAAARRLPCSSCQPFWDAPSPSVMPPGFIVPTEPPTPPASNVARTRVLTVPHPLRFTKKYRTHAQNMLMHFAEARVLVKTTARSRYAPTMEFWSGTDFDILLDNLHLLRAKEAMEVLLSGWTYLQDDCDALFSLVEGLNATYDAHRFQEKEDRVSRMAATRAANKEKKANEKENIHPNTSSSSPSKPLTIRLPPRRSALLPASQPSSNQDLLDAAGRSFISPNWEPPPLVLGPFPRAQSPPIPSQNQISQDVSVERSPKRQRQT